ncbi:ZYRO0D06842p [Zygosaccharomyces rouxii]|uniref:ZYRO0D06842p n=1 Tax=Zygosaccharomyces rouxii (strain ATCC 2623 / CBS 732 / NBRC 1130 / NCYC 568 / NRRL Y-229) TaxID=559307 RepID=C5DVH8_ZYGRC|nr:uncharacterized protein ZYRO0D06842g [Zygosaccharomyces rouxii]KAH9200710.1 vacuolar R-SNARE Nyv1 N terminal-domain-containing protein [Zygosaccharomyces rouxii]CAR27797.1 ZYRO0D06842p [Zygosaccharomyces rouxii]
MEMKKFQVSYVELVHQGSCQASCFQQVEETGSTYGSVGASAGSKELFQRLTHDMVLPKVVPIQGNKVTKLSLHLIDGYECYYTTAPTEDGVGFDVLVSFTRAHVPKILPIRLLSELKDPPLPHTDSQLNQRICNVLDRFHGELLSYRDSGEHGDGTEADLQDIFQVMNDNIDKFLQRQERLSLLVDKTSQLNNNSLTFKRKANRIRQRMWWHRAKGITLLIFSIILCIGAFIMFLYVR